MREVMTLEKFNMYKEKLKALAEEFEEKDLSKDEMKSNIYVKEYEKIEKEIFSYDLSDFDWYEWNDISLIAVNGPLDISESYAEIDLSELKSVSIYTELIAHNVTLYGLDNVNVPTITDNFDEDTIEEYPDEFLSDIFSEELREKYGRRELELKDIQKLNPAQLEEIKEKDPDGKCINLKYNIRPLIEKLGAKKIAKIFEQDQDTIREMYNFVQLFDSKISYNDQDMIAEYIDKIKDVSDIDEIKKITMEYEYLTITKSTNAIEKDKFSEAFISQYSELFLDGVNISSSLKDKCLRRELNVSDLIENAEELKNIDIKAYLNEQSVKELAYILGKTTMQDIILSHQDYFKYNIDGCNQKLKSEFENTEFRELKKFLQHCANNYKDIDYNKQFERYVIYKKHMFESLGCDVIRGAVSAEKLQKLGPKCIFASTDYNQFFAFFGIENLQRFEEKTKIFSKTEEDRKFGYLPIMTKRLKYLHFDGFEAFYKGNFVNMLDAPMTYKDFEEEMYLYMKFLRKRGTLTEYKDYDFIEGDFREEHQDIFISKDAPDELRQAFYKKNISMGLLHKHPEYIEYLVGKDLIGSLNIEFVEHTGSVTAEQLIRRIGSRRFLELLSSYGISMNGISLECSDFDDVDFDDSGIEKLKEAVNYAVFQRIIRIRSGELYEHYENEVSDDFKREYPELFLDGDMSEAFYSRSIKFDDIRTNPQLAEVLANKNLYVAFERELQKDMLERIGNQNYNMYNVLNNIGSKNTLHYLKEYGEYFRYAVRFLDVYSRDINKPTNDIYMQIVDLARNGVIPYDENAPDYLKDNVSDLFLAEDAPQELKKRFYSKTYEDRLTLKSIQAHPEWKEYLIDKSVLTSLLRNVNNKDEKTKFFEKFGKKALPMIYKNAEEINEAIENYNVDLIYEWFKSTGERFLPDYTIMEIFPIDEADKFLTNAQVWSRFMKIDRYSKYRDGQEALLKLCYAYGIFDGDKAGRTALERLLKDAPQKIGKEDMQVFRLAEQMFKNDDSLSESKTYYELVEVMQKNNYVYDKNRPILEQLYIEGKDHSYVLAFDPQKNKEVSEKLRILQEKTNNKTVLTPEKAHQFFGGFRLQYNPKFKNFLNANMKEILANSEYSSYISRIQNQFGRISTANANRALTFERAINYVKENMYADVYQGNEKLQKACGIAGYDQETFDKLQEIYAYTRQRTHSSIPRVEGKKEKYSYEILRLDDPMAGVIGTLSDCCQELGNCAEMCVEHSLTDKHGRVFVVRDEEERIVAQSWVWRNKEVVCFDNIEISNRAIDRVDSQGIKRKDFADEIKSVYIKAAKEMIEKDESTYRKKLEEGKISEEQYEKGRLNRATVGLGYNDIASSIQNGKTEEEKNIVRPLSYNPPVHLERVLYTKDSTVQFILARNEHQDIKEDSDDMKKKNNKAESKGEQKEDQDTLALYTDEYVEYTDKTISKEDLKILLDLDLITNKDDSVLYDMIDEYEENGIANIASSYGLISENTNMIINPNFAIIYERDKNTIKVGELLYNTSLETKKGNIDTTDVVKEQIKLAIEQLTTDETEIDVSELSQEKIEMYQSAIEKDIHDDAERE